MLEMVTNIIDTSNNRQYQTEPRNRGLTVRFQRLETTVFKRFIYFTYIKKKKQTIFKQCFQFHGLFSHFEKILKFE